MDQEAGDPREKTRLRRALRLRRLRLPALSFALILLLSDTPAEQKALPQTDSVSQEREARVPVKRVIDGDTIELANGERVRYLGIDAPELRHKVGGRWIEQAEPFATEAFELNRRLVEGRTVRLELDRESRDRYHRLLAYVFVDDRLVNAELIASGYAVVRIHLPNLRYADLFMKLQAEAQAQRRGLWAFGDRH